ncbi:MAG: TRAP transporter large permease [Clostridiales bacterium]
MIILILFALFFFLLVLSVPIGVTLGITSMAYGFLFNGIRPDYFIQSAITSLDNFPILAVPLFMLAGELMTKGGIARQLFDIAHKLVGRITGGHAIATVLTCMFFGAISGSGPATVAAIGGLMIPMMVNIGYEKKFTTALVAAAGGLGVMIPPSIPMVMYGVVTQNSISDLFLAGIFPGFVFGGCLMIYSFFYCKITKQQLHWDQEEKTLWRAIWDGKWSILMPVIILGGIYGGYFTPTEAACISVIYALIISIFVTKQIPLKEVPDLFIQSAAMIGPLMIIVSMATLFGRILTLEKAPMIISGVITALSDNVVVIMIIINLFLLFVGAVMDTVAAILIVAPVLLPIVQNFGVDPIHFGVIMVVNLAIGFITPPIGINLYVASGISGLSITEITSRIGYPLLVMLAALLIVTFIPAVSLVLLT